jgi:AmmeMemoRadiSam system protein B
MNRVRAPAVAGSFYPADEVTLREEVDALLREAAPRAGTSAPKAIIVPHAAYVYSGPIAASAYATLAGQRDRVTRVVLIGPAHYVGVEGLATVGVDGLATPLGVVPVDTEARDAVLELSGVGISDRAHAPEHSLEVQLPFLQRTLGEQWRVLPLVAGSTDPEPVARVLDAVWGGDETLVVISSDLSHYLDHVSAAAADRSTAQKILGGDTALSLHEACGASPIAGLLLAAHRHALRPHLLDLRDSSETAGRRDRVVGYGAFALSASRPSQP